MWFFVWRRNLKLGAGQKVRIFSVCSGTAFFNYRKNIFCQSERRRFWYAAVGLGCFVRKWLRVLGVVFPYVASVFSLELGRPSTSLSIKAPIGGVIQWGYAVSAEFYT